MYRSHEKVIHDENCIDPETGSHMNMIEGTWSGSKRNMPSRHIGAADISGHLLVYLWRRHNTDNLWEAFVDALKNVHYLPPGEQNDPIVVDSSDDDGDDNNDYETKIMSFLRSYATMECFVCRDEFFFYVIERIFF